ncbi:hypothetical protein GCM10007183_07980 [Staphylococcus muscae]|uniref:LSM domain-containing protein n=1 Tax=Staphylococcus muscae TaxID=1294 RepID=A0ABQ1HRY4_9STAP|nr:hypothetical protein GCM10007183_07980 [Staphylococcus muscae]
MCEVLLDNIRIMLSDDAEGLLIFKGNNISLYLTFENVEQTKKAYNHLPLKFLPTVISADFSSFVVTMTIKSLMRPPRI